MKIAIVTPFFTPFVKGNEYQLASYLARAGHEVHVIASSAKAPREYLESNYDLQLPFQVRYVRTIAALKENPLVLSIDQYMDKDYDILLLQEDYPLICHMAFRFARRNSVPTIVSSERYYYPRDLLKGFPLKALDRTLNRVLWRGCNLITTHTSAAKAFFSSVGAEGSRIRVIPAGVDVETFNPQSEDSFRRKHGAEGKVLILSVARLHPYKGLTYLIRAMEQVVRDNKEVCLIILGKGPQESSLRRLIMALNLEDFVTIDTEVVPNELMPEVYASADIYVQPSIIEPFGIAVLEAMACGKAVIGASIGGMLDTIADGETGFLVPPKEVSSLANRLSHLVNNTALREEMGREGRVRVLSRFDWAVVKGMYEEAIQSITEESK